MLPFVVGIRIAHRARVVLISTFFILCSLFSLHAFLRRERRRIFDKTRGILARCSIKPHRLFKLVGFFANVALSVAILFRPKVGWALPIVLVSAYPLVLRGLSYLLHQKHQRELERHAVIALRYLRGMIATGISLPSALFQLHEANPSPFSESLAPVLDHFSRGVSFEDCLARYRKRVVSPYLNWLPVVLLHAYQNGTSMTPLLDRMIDELTDSLIRANAISNQRKAILSQMAIGLAVPLVFWGALRAFQPEVWIGFINSKYYVQILLSVGAWLLTGGAIVWRCLSYT